MVGSVDIISAEEAKTLPALFRARVERSPDHAAYREYEADTDDWTAVTTWAEAADAVARWRAALARARLGPGDRVAISAPNGRAWVWFDQAALSLGLVVVPIFAHDRPDNAAYVLSHSGARLLLVDEAARWTDIRENGEDTSALETVVSLDGAAGAGADRRLIGVADWLADAGADDPPPASVAPDDLATIVYTSGTTGRPKGVMLSHGNLVRNAWAGLQSVPFRPDDLFLSFLPLSHIFERTVGYYAAMMAGVGVAFARSPRHLAEDMKRVRPTGMTVVPRIFERIRRATYEELEGHPLRRRLFDLAVAVGWSRFQRDHGRGPWRPRHLLGPVLDRAVGRHMRSVFGGHIRRTISGGAPLSPDVAKTFIALGVPVLQGYGLTEASPIVSVNTHGDNDPRSVGRAVATVSVRLGEDDELQVKGPNVMQGYWQNDEATREVLMEDGWLRTGDKARIEDGRIYITGRLKQIIVLANGENVPPSDVEHAVGEDPLVDQVMVVGNDRPYLGALLVVDPQAWRDFARRHNLAAEAERAWRTEAGQDALVGRINRRLSAFPGYARIRRVAVVGQPWSEDNNLLTPTMNKRRHAIAEKHAEEIEALYAGHER